MPYMKDFAEYEPKLPMPCKPDYTTTFYYSKGKVEAIEKPGYRPIRPDANGGTEVSRTALAHCVTEKVLDEDAYAKAQWAYNNEKALLMEQFVRDLYADLGISNHPKRERLFSKAWERGHAYGLSEVYSVAQDLVELIVD